MGGLICAGYHYPGFGSIEEMSHSNIIEVINATNADFIIQCIDDFVSKIEKPTVIILDNAPIHRAHKMLAKRKEWENKDLFVFFLPRYSPHLNRIETLWRKVKYD